jgi:hypothetical protein
MKLYDFIPGLAYRTVSLFGYSLETGAEWRAAYEVLLECFERIGVRPNTITADDVPGLRGEAMPMDLWKRWIARHEFPTPTRLSVESGYLGRLDVSLPWLSTRAYGGISNYFEGGRFMFFSDAGLDRWMPDVYSAIARNAWSVKPFEYGYAHTHADPMRFAAGSGELNDELRWKWQTFTIGTRGGEARYSEQLRDVFPLNYLVASHLNFKLGEQTLGEWISDSQTRGLLTSLQPGLWCWSVPETVISQIRAALEPSGLLVAPGGP